MTLILLITNQPLSKYLELTLSKLLIWGNIPQQTTKHKTANKYTKHIVIQLARASVNYWMNQSKVILINGSSNKVYENATIA